MKDTKILRNHQQTIQYSQEHWDLLQLKRQDALSLLEPFSKAGLNPHLFGSVARGDVHIDSDIDIFFTEPIPPFRIELLLENQGYKNYSREILMATPKDTLKLYIYLSELESITLPLIRFDKNSLEFYDFGGKIDYNQLYYNARIEGVDKRLIFINPTENGHEELSLIGNEHLIAKKLNVSMNVLQERKRVLLRREESGRTGVFFKRELALDESIEQVLKVLANKKSIIRKKLYQK